MLFYLINGKDCYFDLSRVPEGNSSNNSDLHPAHTRRCPAGHMYDLVCPPQSPGLSGLSFAHSALFQHLVLFTDAEQTLREAHRAQGPTLVHGTDGTSSYSLCQGNNPPIFQLPNGLSKGLNGNSENKGLGHTDRAW